MHFIMSLQGVQDEVKYTVKDHAKFLTLIQKANAVKSLDLSALERKTQSFTTGSVPKWKPDAKLDAVTSTLLASNINVKVCIIQFTFNLLLIIQFNKFN